MERINITPELEKAVGSEKVAALKAMYARQDAALAATSTPVSQAAPVFVPTEPTPTPAAPIPPVAPPAAAPVAPVAPQAPVAPTAPATYTEADVQRERDRVAGSKGREIQQLRQQLADALAARPVAAEPPPPPVVPVTATVDASQITDEMLFAEYGEETVNRVGADVYRPIYASQLRREAAAARKQAQADGQSQRNALFANVYAALPQARELDAMQASNGILEFLNGAVPGRGSVTYGEMYALAERKGDASALVSIYKDFLAANPPASPAANSAPAYVPPPVAVVPASVVPSSAAIAISSATPSGVSIKGYKAFMDDVLAHPEKHTQAEIKQRELEFATARQNEKLVP